MAKFTSFNLGTLTTLAASLALVGLPVEALAQDAQQQEQQPQQDDQQQRGWRGGGDPSSHWRGRGSGDVAGREARAAVHAHQHPSGETTGWTHEFRRRRADGASTDWQNGTPIGRPGATAGTMPQADIPRRHDWRDRSMSHGDWTRNRSYTDPARSSRAYRDAEEWRRRERHDGSHWSGTHDRQNARWRHGSGWNDDRSNRWSRDWRRDNRYNWQGYRNTNRNVYRIGRYYAPYQNYTYRRLNIGFHLQPRFYGNSYWINSPWQYRLPEADGPYRWVRYYDDALLVDIYSGEVVDVIHDFFW